MDYLFIFFPPRAAYIIITCVESVSVQFVHSHRFVVKSKHVLFVLYLFICFCISHLIQRRLSGLFVSVSLKIVWLVSFTLVSSFSPIPLVQFQPNWSHRILGCRGVTCFSSDLFKFL